MVLKLVSAVRIKRPNTLHLDLQIPSGVVQSNLPPWCVPSSWLCASAWTHWDKVLTVSVQQPWLLTDSCICEQPATHLGLLDDASLQLYSLFHRLAFKRAFVWPHPWNSDTYPIIKGVCPESTFSRSGMRLLLTLPFFSLTSPFGISSRFCKLTGLRYIVWFVCDMEKGSHPHEKKLSAPWVATQSLYHKHKT